MILRAPDRLILSMTTKAQSLGISRIIIHRYSSILSAYGLALADRVHEAQE
jgi:N-methylhydantoinase A/oxoprolinase/acetone carboxylase beta subunit